VKCLGDTNDTANTQTLDILGNSRNDVFIVIGRYSRYYSTWVFSFIGEEGISCN
jgi:hypothetical protein